MHHDNSDAFEFGLSPSAWLLLASLLIVWGLFLGGLYLLLQARGSYLPSAVYWISVVIVFCVLLSEILVLPVNEYRFQIPVLVQALAFATLIASTINAVTPYGIPAFDTHFETGAVAQLMENRWPLSLASTQPTVRLVSDWPALHILAIEFILIAGTSLETVALSTPQILYVLGFVAFYLTCRRLFPSDSRVALTVLVVVPATFAIAPDPVFVRNSIGFCMLLFAILSLTVATSNRKGRVAGWAGCQAIFIMALTFSHNLNALFFLIFCGLWLVVPRLIAMAGRPRLAPGRIAERKRGLDSGLNSLVLGGVLFIAYIIWVGNDFFMFAIPTIFHATTAGFSSQSSFTISSSRAQAAVIMNIVVATAMAAVFIYHRRRHRLCDHVATETTFFSLGVSVVALTLLLSRLPGLQGFSIPTYRGLGFAWPFIYAAGLHSLLVEVLPSHQRHLTSASKRDRVGRLSYLQPPGKLVTAFVVSILVAIPISTLLQMNPVIVDNSVQPNYEAGGVRPYLLPGEIAFAQSFQVSGKVFGDQGVYSLLAEYQNKFVYVDLDILTAKETPSAKGQWLVYRSENQHGLFAPYQTPSELVQVNWTRLSTLPGISRVYDSGDIQAYWIH